MFVFSFWQSSFFASFFRVLRGGDQLLSPMGNDSNFESRVLGDVATLENNIDYGEVGKEENVLAQGAYAYDLTAGKILFEKDSRKSLQAASTVKIVTAAVALDRGQLGEEMTVNYFPTVVGESSMFLSFGEKFTLEELLYGLIVVSGNDCAETIAQGLGGKRETFVDWMNEFAQKVGAVNTHFTTPSGLDEDGQYTTAYDLFLMGKYVFSNYPKVVEISVTRERYLPKTVGHRAYLLKNKLLLLDAFPIIAAKPGLGEQKMLSLVTLLEKDNHKILVALIRTPSIRHDLTQILKPS